MANEQRLIDANALLEKMEYTSTDVCEDYGYCFCQHGYSTPLLRLMVNETPTVDAVEVVHGRWIEDTYCSNCRWFAEDEEGHIVQSFHNYCPNCGAKMDLED